MGVYLIPEGDMQDDQCGGVEQIGESMVVPTYACQVIPTTAYPLRLRDPAKERLRLVFFLLRSSRSPGKRRPRGRYIV